MDVHKWPSAETMLAIGEQTRRVSEFIRDAVPTTAGKRLFRSHGKRPVITELDRLAYLFYGRSLADYDADREQTARLGWLTSLAGWIIATPGSQEHPAVKDFLQQDAGIATHTHFSGWDNRVASHVSVLFHGLATLRVYFGQLVFHRTEWIGAGDWLRQEILTRLPRLACCPDTTLGPWFDRGLCRAPMYLLRRPGPFWPADQLRRAALIPAEIELAGTIEAPKTDGLPAEWLDELDGHATKLLAELGTINRPQPNGPVTGFVPNRFQDEILRVLDSRALTGQKLANEVCEGERTRLYRSGGIQELRSLGLVEHKPRLGYYRPDCPPKSSVN